MRVVIQKVSEASVTVNKKIISSIGVGLLVLVGIVNDDDKEDVEWLCKKIANLRIFNDDDGVMNKSLIDVGGEVIVVSQFTLHAKTKKGNRPSYIDAAKPDIAFPLYNQFINTFDKVVGKNIQTGQFGVHMDVKLVNDGPVTIIIDSKNKDF